MTINVQLLVIIDVQPNDLELPVSAYVAVEEVHSVSCNIYICKFIVVYIKFCDAYRDAFYRMAPPRAKRLNICQVR